MKVKRFRDGQIIKALQESASGQGCMPTPITSQFFRVVRRLILLMVVSTTAFAADISLVGACASDHGERVLGTTARVNVDEESRVRSKEVVKAEIVDVLGAKSLELTLSGEASNRLTVFSSAQDGRERYILVQIDGVNVALSKLVVALPLNEPLVVGFPPVIRLEWIESQLRAGNGPW